MQFTAIVFAVILSAPAILAQGFKCPPTLGTGATATTLSGSANTGGTIACRYADGSRCLYNAVSASQ